MNSLDFPFLIRNSFSMSRNRSFTSTPIHSLPMFLIWILLLHNYYNNATIFGLKTCIISLGFNLYTYLLIYIGHELLRSCIGVLITYKIWGWILSEIVLAVPVWNDILSEVLITVSVCTCVFTSYNLNNSY